MADIDAEIARDESSEDFPAPELPKRKTRTAAKKTRTRTQKQQAPISAEIIESDDERLHPSPMDIDDMDESVSHTQHRDIDTIDLSEEETSVKKATRKRKPAAPKTPKRDILNSLLARKRG